jgi:hypothetical protein
MPNDNYKKQLYSGDNALGAFHIAGNLESYEAARSAFFVLTVPESQLTNLRKPTDSAIDDASAALLNSTNASEILRLNVTKTSVPQFSVGVEQYRRGNDVVKFATVPEWESGTLEVDDVVGVNTKDILISWLYLAYNPQTRMGGRMKDYKKTAILQEYTQDYELIREWQIDGIFIKKVTDSEFDRENDAKRKVSVEFEYDRAILTEVNYGTSFK